MANSGEGISLVSLRMLSHSISVGSVSGFPLTDVTIKPGTRRPNLVSFDPLHVDSKHFSFDPDIPRPSANPG